MKSNIELNCSKQNYCNVTTEVCDTVSGLCICAEGYFGHNCQQSKCCENLVFSLQREMNNECFLTGKKHCVDSSCSSNGVCDYSHGLCICNKGYKGQSCQGCETILLHRKLSNGFR